MTEYLSRTDVAIEAYFASGYGRMWRIVDERTAHRYTVKAGYASEDDAKAGVTRAIQEHNKAVQARSQAARTRRLAAA